MAPIVFSCGKTTPLKSYSVGITSGSRLGESKVQTWFVYPLEVLLVSISGAYDQICKNLRHTLKESPGIEHLQHEHLSWFGLELS